MISLFSHNETAHEAAEEMLVDFGKTPVIHPTGTGKSFISEERRQLLDEIGFDWHKPNERMWETHYASAQAYCAEHANLSIPATYRDESGYLLGKWLKTQRASKEKLTGQHMKRLNDIGMEW